RNSSLTSTAGISPAALLLSDTPPITSSVQDLRGKDHGIMLHIVFIRIPTGVDSTPEEIKNLFIRNTSRTRHDVSTISGKDPIAGFERRGCASLGSFLTKRGGP